MDWETSKLIFSKIQNSNFFLTSSLAFIFNLFQDLDFSFKNEPIATLVDWLYSPTKVSAIYLAEKRCSIFVSL